MKTGMRHRRLPGHKARIRDLASENARLTGQIEELQWQVEGLNHRIVNLLKDVKHWHTLAQQAKPAPHIPRIPMTTEDFNIGQTVTVNKSRHFMNGMVGRVTDRDAYTVEVQFDGITPEMLHFDDTRKGFCSFDPGELI